MIEGDTNVGTGPVSAVEENDDLFDFYYSRAEEHLRHEWNIKNQ